MRSFYLSVRDGTKLAVTLYRPDTDNKAPVVWKHDRYHTRNQPSEDKPAFERFKNKMLNEKIAWVIYDGRLESLEKVALFQHEMMR